MKPSAPHNVIVAAVDRTEATDQVVYTATSLARMIPGSELHLVHVIDIGQPPGALLVPPTETMNEGHVFLEELELRIAEHFPGRITTHIAADVPGQFIVKLASELDADLLVVGSHGKGGLARLLLGSVSQHVVNNASCAVLVARPKEQVAVPEIEPPCPSCLEVREATGGETLWCAQHSAKRPNARLHYEMPKPFALGSMLLRPDA